MRTEQQKIEPYISPFILNAKRTADERAKKALRILKEGKLTPVVNEWDQNTRTAGLFDPALKKQEIFRVEPRNKQREKENERPATAAGQSPSSGGPRGNPRLTMRTSSAAPTRVPQTYRVNPNVVRADHPLNLPPKERSRSPPHPTALPPPHPPTSSSSATPNRPTLVSKGTDPLENSSSPRGRDRRSPSPEEKRKMTRSTSPIDEKIVDKILTAEESDEQRRKKKPYSILEEVLHEKYRAGKGDLNKHYGDLIRERLKSIINRQRGRGSVYYPPPPPPPPHENDEEGEGEEEEFAHPAYYRPSRYYYPPHHTPMVPRHQKHPQLDPQQVYTKDMMASMATIMSAVGDILVNRSSKDYWRKSSRRKRRSSTSHSPSTPTASATQPHTTDHTITPPTRNHEAANHHPESHRPYNQPGEGIQFNHLAASDLKRSAKVGSSDFLKEMSAMVFQQQGLPKSKSVISDMILQKLQSIENTEKEIADYLKKRAATSSTAHIPPPPSYSQQTIDDEEEPRSLPPPSPSSKERPVIRGKAVNQGTPSSLVNHPPETASTVTSPSPALTADKLKKLKDAQAKEALERQNFAAVFPTLHSVGCDQLDAIQDYAKELQYVQKLQEAIYDKKHTTMAITVDTISDVLFDRVLYAVTDEVEHVIDDYAAKVVQKI